MIEADRLIQPSATREDEAIDRAIRPKLLSDYTGQEHVKEQMEIFIQAARNRNDALDHLLIFGPPGLGKTTLANIVANEMGVSIKMPCVVMFLACVKQAGKRVVLGARTE